jgi:enoyl-CoA hydratase/carnithine racemase
MALVEVSRDGDLAVLRLNRPEKHNALSTAAEAELMAALSSAELTGSAAVVLAGNGRSFCAGADVTEVRGMGTEAILAYYRDAGRVYETVAALAQPTVTAIHGYCLGGGFELALATDFRVADETARFGFPEVGLGILPSSGGTLRVVRACGPVRARELLLLGRRLEPAEAIGLGLVTETVPAGQALPRALELARELAALPTAAVAVVTQAIDAAAEAPASAALLIERLAYAALNATAEAAERQARFHP